MRAIILAAGRGSRMGSLTHTRPKCLVQLAGRPLLDWQLSALREGGVSEISVVAGYQASMMQSDQYHLFVNPSWATSNMVASLMCAAEWLRVDSCIVSYSDIAYHPSIIRDLASSPELLAISYDRYWKQLWSDRFEDPLVDAERFSHNAEGALVTIGGKARSLAEVQGQYMGLLKFTPAGWHTVENYLQTVAKSERDRLDMTGLLNQLIRAEIKIHTVPSEGRWCEVDSREDLEIYEQRLKDIMPWRHDWRWQDEAA